MHNNYKHVNTHSLPHQNQYCIAQDKYWITQVVMCVVNWVATVSISVSNFKKPFEFVWANNMALLGLHFDSEVVCLCVCVGGGGVVGSKSQLINAN